MSLDIRREQKKEKSKENGVIMRFLSFLFELVFHTF